MNQAADKFTVKSHFEGKDPVVRKIYDHLLKALRQIGPIQRMLIAKLLSNYGP